MIVGKVGYEIVLPGSDSYKDYLGDHGYDNRQESMHPIFYAFGPAFRQNLLAKPFRNVDIYPLMRYLLRLDRRETNGSFDRVTHILNDFPSRTTSDYLGKIAFINKIHFSLFFFHFSSHLSNCGDCFLHILCRMCLSSFSQIGLRATYQRTCAVSITQ